MDCIRARASQTRGNCRPSYPCVAVDMANSPNTVAFRNRVPRSRVARPQILLVYRRAPDSLSTRLIG